MEHTGVAAHGNTVSAIRILIPRNLYHTSVEREHRLSSPRFPDIEDTKLTINQNGNLCVFIVTMVHWLYVHVETREAVHMHTPASEGTDTSDQC